MFDIGFSEIVVIGVVALVVIGPERLPKTARTLGHLFGRLQRYVSEVKADISREMELDELRKLQREMQGAAREFQQSVTTAASDVQAGIRNVERELNQAGAASDIPTPAAGTDGAPPTGAAPGSGSGAPVPSGQSPAAEASRQAALPGFDKI
ncbi:MAG TPA: Sec-independent protein translocase protein TatB [Casimicrobiaceae bacterium]|nr:Sec-independent protein translocase protein TatB [Casimicrobiaceae bacterium]